MLASGFDCVAYFGPNGLYAGFCDLTCRLCVASGSTVATPSPPPPPPPPRVVILPEGNHECANLWDESTSNPHMCENVVVVSQLYTCDEFCPTCEMSGYCDGLCGLCPLPEPEPEPEPEPVPEPEPDPMPGFGFGCPREQIMDCNGRCMPSMYLGDGTCDDGAFGNLWCEETQFDQGDCLVPEEDTVLDCLGQVAPILWIGDGMCDNGVNAHDNAWIDLNCEEHDFDGGDCAGDAGSITQFQCVQLLQALDVCESVADNRFHGCRNNGCAEAIVQMRVSWDQCHGQLGDGVQNTDDIIREYELICGMCSPLPELDICGIYGSFPTTQECSSVCAPTLVSWYEENFNDCQSSMLDKMEASEEELQQLSAFYDRCKETPVDFVRPQDECDAFPLGVDIGEARVQTKDASGTCRLDMIIFQETCGVRTHRICCEISLAQKCGEILTQSVGC